MSFDFFNTSHLAFGSKLTQAFTELEKQLEFSKESIIRLQDYLDMVDSYTNRNYRAPVPSGETSPVRTNELFDIFNDKSCYIKDLYFNTNDNLVHVKLLLYDQTNNLFTAAAGTSSIKKGYCYVKKSISNNYPIQTLSFSKVQDSSKGTMLFQYRVDNRNQLNLKNVNSIMLISAADDNEFRSVGFDGDISFPYTATDYECICAVGWTDNLYITLNNRVVCKGSGHKMQRHCILYLKPGDVVNGAERGFKIGYFK